ncbi:MAG: T9SS type A sorting domain-containing protein [bacterium]|nr:T9SS type A sorting domain-containing protein [bacterium]
MNRFLSSTRFTLLLLTLIFCLLGTNAYAQLWTREYDLGAMDFPTCIRSLPDGGFIVSGFSYIQISLDYDYYAWLARLNSNGDTLWTRRYQVGDSAGYFKSVVTMPGGGYLAAGGTGNYDGLEWIGENQNRKNWFVRVNEIGDTLWTRKYGTNFWNRVNDLVVAADSSIYACGGSVIMQMADIYHVEPAAMRISASGDSLWMNIYPEQIGSEGFRIDDIPGGGFVIGGNHTFVNYFSGYIDKDMLMMIIDTAGTGRDIDYYSRVPPLTIVPYEDGFGALAASDTTLFCYGYTAFSWQNTGHPWLIRMNATMTQPLMDTTYGGTAFESFRDMIEVEDGFVFTGQTDSLPQQGHVWLYKIDRNGNPIWYRVFGQSSPFPGSRLTRTQNNGFVILTGTNANLQLICVDSVGTVAVPETPTNELPNQIALLSSYPNPFNAAITVRVNLAASSSVSLELYNIAGQCLQAIHQGNLATGSHSFRLDGKSLPSGVYFLVLHTNNQCVTQKIALIR